MEGYGASTYGDRIADVYDLWYGEGLNPDTAVGLLAGLAQGGRALELGIGTGRVAIPLSRAGVEVMGIDASEAMVTQLRGKPGAEEIEVVLGDFVDVAVDGLFSLIYVPFTTFFGLGTRDRQLQCLHNVAQHLDPVGHFVLDAFVPDFSRRDNDQWTETLPGGVDYVLIDSMRHDPVTQTIEGHHMLIKESGIRLFPLHLRYCWPSELDAMAETAGLHLVERYGDYDQQPFDSFSTRHVSIYAPVQRVFA
jgi:SAM-dependent methyltransferase